MALTNDRDLAVIEPALFTQATTAGTELLSGSDGQINGTTLTSGSSDFEAAGIDAGHVVVIGGEVLEIVERLSVSSLTVSRLRADVDDPPITPADGSAMPFQIITFDRIALAEQAAVLAAVGVGPDHPFLPLDETAIINAEEVAHLVGLQTLARAFASASAAAPTDVSLIEMATLSLNRAAAAAPGTVVRLDLDGDGAADSSRRVGVVVLSRL